MRLVSVLTFFWLVFLFVMVRPSFAVTVLTHPDKATYVSEYQPNRPQSGGPALRVGNYVRDNHGYEQYILLKFFTDDVPKNANISSAKLALWQGEHRGLDVGEEIVISRVQESWSEDVTWDDDIQMTGRYAFAWVEGKNGWTEWNITKLMQEWVNGTYRNQGLAVTTNGISDDYGRTFASPRFEQVDKRPKLTIVYTTPTPTPGLVQRTVQNTTSAIGSGIGKVTITPITSLNANAGVGGDAALTISNITVANVTDATTDISWKTNKSSSSWVFYGNATSGDTFTLQTGQNDSTTSHTVKLSGLASLTKYSFKVMSKDANNQQTFGSITYVTTAASAGEGTEMMQSEETAEVSETTLTPVSPTPTPTDSNVLTQAQDAVKNKVVDYTLSKSLEEGNVATQEAGEDSAARSFQITIPKDPVVLVASWMGVNKFAMVLLGVIVVMAIIIFFLLHRGAKKVHKHIRKHLDPDYDED